jgi:hypothetical protein
MIRTQIQLTPEQAMHARERAVAEGVSISELLRRALDAYLEIEDRRERRERMIASIGKFRSGLHDISERHDDYLAEAFYDFDDSDE